VLLPPLARCIFTLYFPLNVSWKPLKLSDRIHSFLILHIHSFNMKFSTALIATFAALVAATPTEDKTVPKNKATGADGTGFKKVGKQEEVQGIIFAPDMGNSAVTPGASFVKLRYGPYKLKANKMTNTGGVMKKPCSSCYIVAQQAGLEYADGSQANIDTGSWLHHMVATNSAAKGIGCVPGERFFASGNEREPRRFNDYGNWGYYVSPAAAFISVIELVSLGHQTQ
jgi:hypothetical protein